MIHYQYNRQVATPAPFVYVKVSRGDGSDLSVRIPALVDSGADRTVIPQSLVDDLGLIQVGELEAAGLNHVRSIMSVYVIQIGIHDLPPVVRKVICAGEEQYVLLGRNVLNYHRIALDGPNLQCIIE